MIGFRVRKGGPEYLLKWENSDEPTWEPEDNLCDTVLEDAKAFRFKLQEEALLRDDHESGVAPPPPPEDNDMETGTDRANHNNDDTVAADAAAEHQRVMESLGGSDFWDWSTAGQLKYQEVEHLHVDDPQARLRVTNARRYGIPLVLNGHKGWPQFAKRWLKGHDEMDQSPLDLSQPHEVDVSKMIADIGNEGVPIRRKRDPHDMNPNMHCISLKRFLENAWPSEANQSPPNPSFYLHQWQFPLSETAVTKLCGPDKCHPLPNYIIGADLLRYLHDGQAYRGDNVYQYIFMGNRDTFSQLHCDKGALMITIAPIVGQKEVVMVHRADGPTSLYHLEAKIDAPNFHEFPLMTTTRMWRTVLEPGQILIMPQGTYHQCRNVTPCLSYHRFHLDTVNLKAFLESYFDEDSKEIDHLDIIWNSAYELHVRIEEYTNQMRKEWKECGRIATTVPPEIQHDVETLRSLRHISREVEMRLKRKGDPDEEAWTNMVEDIDVTLHNVQYRYHERLPRYKRASSRRKKDRVTNFEKLKETKSKYEKQCTSLSKEEKNSVIPDSVPIAIGDEIVVKLHDVKVTGHVVEIQEQLYAAYLDYDEFDQNDSGYAPFDCLRVKVSGESFVGINPSDIGAGKTVYYADNGENYRAKVASWRRGTFYRVASDTLKAFPLWVSREAILEKICIDSTDEHEPPVPHRRHRQ